MSKNASNNSENTAPSEQETPAKKYTFSELNPVQSPSIPVKSPVQQSADATPLTPTPLPKKASLRKQASKENLTEEPFRNSTDRLN